MRVLGIDGARPAGAALRAATSVLRQGGIVAFPTDTVYGLAVDPRSAAAVARLFAVKAREGGLAIPLIAADVSQVDACAHLTPLARQLADRWWPGPLAVVLEARSVLSRNLLGPQASVAVRVPAHAVAVALARAFGFAIGATSANRSGGAPAATGRDVVPALGDRVDLVLDAGGTAGGPPSTIVDARSAEPGLVREGAVSWHQVLQSLA